MAEVKDFTKDPDAVLDYVWDWSAWLDDDVIDDFEVLPADGITVQSSSATDTAVTVWLADGELNATYAVTCRIFTLGGRTDDRTSRFRVRAL